MAVCCTSLYGAHSPTRSSRPAQETRNADVVLAAGAALKVNDLPLLATTVDAALNGARREAMARAMGALGRPNAAFEIADALLSGTLRARAAPDAE